MKCTSLSVFLLAILVAGAGAQSLTVTYLEGSASQRNAGPWTPLSIGDAVPRSAAVRLDRLGLVQLKAPGSSITLAQPGTYLISTVMAASASLKSAGAVQAAAVAFSRVIAGRGTTMNAVGGVRSEMPATAGLLDAGGVEGASAEEAPAAPAPAPARAAIGRARDLIAGGQYSDAVLVLRQAIPGADPDPAREADFYLASALELSGDIAGALSALKAACPRGTDDWAPDATLLGARLLEDTYAWPQARDLLVKSGPVLSSDDERAGSYFFLLALAYRGTGEAAREREMLDTVISRDPAGSLAAAASRLRDAP